MPEGEFQRRYTGRAILLGPGPDFVRSRSRPPNPWAVYLDELAALSGAAFDRRFLELMVDHHVAGIDMASYAAEHAERDEVSELAATMVDSQRNEVKMMNDMLGS